MKFDPCEVEKTDDYPLSCPNLTLQAFFLSREAKAALMERMLLEFVPSEPVIYTWAEMLRESLNEHHLEQKTHEGGSKPPTADKIADKTKENGFKIRVDFDILTLIFLFFIQRLYCNQY